MATLRSLAVPALLLGSAILLSGCTAVTYHVEARAWALQASSPVAATLAGVAVDQVALATASSGGAAMAQDAQEGALDAGVASLAGATSRAEAHAEGNGGAARGWTVATGVSLLGGLVTADAIRAEATFATPGGSGIEGSAFHNLRVNGLAVPEPIAPGTSFTVNGVVVALKEVLATGTTVQVTMLRVTEPGGTLDVQVAVAFARADPGSAQPGCAGASAVAVGLEEQGQALLRAAAEGAGGPASSFGHALGYLRSGLAAAQLGGSATRASVGSGSAGASAMLEATGIVLSLPQAGLRVEADAATLEAVGSAAGSSASGSAGTTFTGLRVNGASVDDPVGANNRLGPFSVNGNRVTVVLNEQRVAADPASGTVGVEAAAIHVSGVVSGQPLEVRVLGARIAAEGC